MDGMSETVRTVRFGPLGMRVDIPASGVDCMRRDMSELSVAAVEAVEAKAMADYWYAEFIRWQERKQREDIKYFSSIVKAWMA